MANIQGCSMLQKWITSMTSFASIIFPVLDLIKPKRIGEIGAAEGGNTELLYHFVKDIQGQLVTIDPSPRGTFLQWVSTCKDHVQHIQEASLTAIAKAQDIDVWFVDGDHNWYTVYHELELIDRMGQQSDKPLIVFMHDVAWPCGRRDMYYDPKQIPIEFLQPFSTAEEGITLIEPVPITGFLKGPYWAKHEGGAKNGVLTAVEDFLAKHEGRYHWVFIPAFLGLGILIDLKHPDAKKIMNFYAVLHNNPLLEMMENDRLTHYISASALTNKNAAARDILSPEQVL
jgi:hypothetical protein